MRKILIILLCLLLVGCVKQETSDLPLPESADGIRGSQLGIDKNINEDTIDNYLNRDDAVYRDMRMLKDEANYEAIGGDSYLSGYIKGFEVVPYPYLCNVVGLPDEVGETYSGATLFTLNDDGSYTSNYVESINILEELFPKDKVIFLMCGGGGYAGMTKSLLVSQGYDENKIYNVGGYWYYKGRNSIITTLANGEHNFDNVPYHYIDFSKLTAVNGYDPNKEHVSPRDSESNIIEISSLDEIDTDNYLLLVTMKGCTSCAAFKPVISEYSLITNEIIYSIDIGIVEEALSVKYTPTLILYRNGNEVDRLDPMSNDDTKYYETIDNLKNWVKENTTD